MNAPKRTIKEAIDLDSMLTITSDYLLTINEEKYQEIRHRATFGHKEGQPKYVCAKCFAPVYASNKNQKPFWQHFSGASDICPWWTGSPENPDDISAKIFQGRQESYIHSKLKNLIADLLRNDPKSQKIKVEEKIIGEGKWKVPDVYVEYENKRIVIELQLATTQIDIIADREIFYKKESIELVWVTWNFEKKPISEIQQCFKDISYRHRNNIFSIDEETIILSREKSTFLFRAQTYQDDIWHECFCSLSELKRRGNGLSYILSPLCKKEKFRERWIEETTPEGTDFQKAKDLISEILHSISFAHQEEIYDEELARVINCLISLQKGVPIGTRENNLVAYTNSFFLSPSRSKYAKSYEWAAQKFGRHELLNNQTVKSKLAAAKNSPQLKKGDLKAKILHYIFEDWFKDET
ncbi:MAG: hypothetical protein KJ017_08280 [Alphaproteobacteria bacterium]|nr:hypothetical protein [Alphaproteobacteria bacterium]